ncbi:hypothetical protein COU60_00405 [Candidatus Pacearchaeota archaeon CG10_big_fil_rev_8_21_14_0_10_34_76]|nr:MAG: hypothetical protein COU60_00405 [Candidatus Pacearchaeota archaeon CG10_big_fil_rev_8_21_14_0_10_34_76]
MAIRSRENLFGAWAFLIGVVLSLAVGILSFGSLHPIILGVLVIIGLIVGFVNVSPKNVNTFLMAAVSLVIVSFAGVQGVAKIEFLTIGDIVNSTLGALLVMLVPATIVVAIKSLFSISAQS